MKFVRNIVLVLLLATSLLQAKDFMGIPIEDPVQLQTRPLPAWLVGGGGFVAYYLNSLDGGVVASVDRRLGTHHSLGAVGHVYFGNDLMDIGLNYRFYFSGSLMSGHDDFLRAGFAGMYMEKKDETYFSPMVSFGYGRDILFFEKANLVGRVEVRAAYLLGEAVSKNEGSEFIDRTGHFLVFVDFLILFF